jgi:hypothetical protein
MSAEAADEPKYEVWVEDRIHSWNKDTISVPEMRELDLVAEQEVPLPEDAVHSVPPREAGRPLVKRTHFRKLG